MPKLFYNLKSFLKTKKERIILLLIGSKRTTRESVASSVGAKCACGCNSGLADVLVGLFELGLLVLALVKVLVAELVLELRLVLE